jgi:hypothetical protein
MMREGTARVDHTDFLNYIDILKQQPFSLYPAPQGPDLNVNWRLKKFSYVSDSPTHVTIEDTDNQKTYELSLVLIEFANRGVLRLTRQVVSFDGSFV